MGRDSTGIPLEGAADIDPIYDCKHGTKTSVTTNADLITPPAGCKYVRVVTDANIMIRTDGGDAADDASSIMIPANLPEIIPVTAGVKLRGLSLSGTAIIRCTPMKARE